MQGMHARVNTIISLAPPCTSSWPPSPPPTSHAAHGRALRRGAPALLQLQVPHPAQDQLRHKCGSWGEGRERRREEWTGKVEGGGVRQSREDPGRHARDACGVIVMRVA